MTSVIFGEGIPCPALVLNSNSLGFGLGFGPPQIGEFLGHIDGHGLVAVETFV